MNVLLDSNIALDIILQRECVQFVAGESLAVSYIITRDPCNFGCLGYAASGIPVVSPEKFLDMITID